MAPLGAVTAWDYEDLDVGLPDVLRRRVLELRPDVIVNASAYTDVDGAEQAPARAFGINATAPQILAEQAKSSGALLIHYSTDYVFDGSKGSPYTEQDSPHPLNVYGASKLAGEQAIQDVGGAYLILRTAWLYSMRGSNFISKVLAWARKHEKLRIVDDQVSNPTWARMLAETTTQVLSRGGAFVRERGGIYHLAAEGYASRYEWAQAILKLDPKPDEQKATELLRAVTADIPTPARRPLFSALDCSRFGAAFNGIAMPPWQMQLSLAME